MCAPRGTTTSTRARTRRAAWSVAPYPVVLVTVDAVVRAAGQVLLVRRGRMPGKGLWALPGGFVDPAETVYRSALRELVEETRIEEAALHAALRGVQVFDDPGRSQRGRVACLPAAKDGDDTVATVLLDGVVR